MKPQPRLHEFGLKKLDFTCLCPALILLLSATFTNASQTAQTKPAKSSKSSPTVSKPVKSSAKSSKNASKGKKTASRSKKPRRKVTQGQRTIEATRVLEIQNALAAAGYYKEAPNGQWDDSTSRAMSSYQQDNGFRTTGKPDALSLKKLGL